ncbi:hypothetical protein AGMMS49983_17180 [Clostridia bacterium]|nr:hypothetical protein AGMMS49983_17180 [Clostridia bacterium]
MFTDPELKGDMYRDLIMGLIFAFVGCIALFRSIALGSKSVNSQIKVLAGRR